MVVGDFRQEKNGGYGFGLVNRQDTCAIWYDSDRPFSYLIIGGFGRDKETRKSKLRPQLMVKIISRFSHL